MKSQFLATCSTNTGKVLHINHVIKIEIMEGKQQAKKISENFVHVLLFSDNMKTTPFFIFYDLH